MALNSWLLYFYVNVAGLPALWAGMAFVAGRLFDAVLDPVVGRWSDRVRPRRGRVVFLRWALLPTALAYVALWWLPVAVEATALKVAAATGGFMLFSLGYTLVSIPRLAMIAELEPRYDGRTRLVTANMVVIFLAALVAIALTPALVLGLAGTDELARSPALAWIAVAALFAGVGVAATLPFLVAIPDPPGGEGAVLPAPLGAELRSLARATGYARIVAIFMLAMLAMLIVQAMTPFWLESVVGVPGPEQAPILGAIFALSILSFPAWSAVSARLGKARALVAGIAVYMVFLALVPFVPRQGTSGMLLVAVAFAGLGVSAMNLFPWAMLPDAIDLDRAARGRRREGLVTAVFVLGHKLAGSLAVAMGAVVLWLSGHRAGEVAQAEETRAALVWMTGPVPLLVLALAAALAWRYPVDRAMQERARAAVRDVS